MGSKVTNWVECDLRYVGETKLARLDDGELVKLHHLLVAKHGLSHAPLSGNREANIAAVMALKVQIAKKKESYVPPAPPLPLSARAEMIDKVEMLDQTIYESIEAPAPAPASTPAPVPYEEHDTRGPEPGSNPGLGPKAEDELTAAAKAFDMMFSTEEKAAPTGEPVASAQAIPPPDVMSEEEKRAKEDRDARISAFVQLAAAASPPMPTGDDDTTSGINAKVDAEAVTVDEHHRLRICSFNACKMRLGSANKAYIEAGDDGTCEEYEGTHKGAELAKKWLTLASRMADFDVILLQEVPGAEKVMDQKIETFASMLEIATEEGRYWTAINSQKSGKDGKVVGPGAEVHVCFVKSPVQFKAWNTLRKVGATELDYAPLQVVLRDERFADPADRDFVITSVHLPPSKRVDARDSQIAALLRNYSAPDTSEYRMQMPFKPNKDVKVSPAHILAGDYNTFPGNEQYNMLGSGFVSKIPQDAATTSGHQNYDNILVDTRANERLLIGGGIMQLKDPHNAAKGEVGLSDHYPVFVEICEVQKTGKAGPLPEPAREDVQICQECAPGDAKKSPSPPEEAKEEEKQPPTLEEVKEEEKQPSVPSADEEKEGEVVKEVVEKAMQYIMQGVLDASDAVPTSPEPTKATEQQETVPLEAAPATVEAPFAPPLVPAPASDTTPTPVPPEEQWQAAWEEAIAGPFPRCSSPVEEAALPEGLTTLASESDSEPESAPVVPLVPATPALAPVTQEKEEVVPPLLEVE